MDCIWLCIFSIHDLPLGLSKQLTLNASAEHEQLVVRFFVVVVVYNNPISRYKQTANLFNFDKPKTNAFRLNFM